MVCGQECSPKPENQPQPPSAQLHVGQRLHAGLRHALDLVLVEDRVAVEALPALGPLLVVADLLGVEVGALLLDLLEVQLHAAAGSLWVMTVGRKRLSVCSVQP